MKSWTFILFYLFFFIKSLQWNSKSKSKTSKKFKKGVSFVFTLVNLHCFTIQNSQFNTAVINPTIKQQNWSFSSFNVSCDLVNRLIQNSAVVTENGPTLQISVHPPLPVHQHCEKSLSRSMILQELIRRWDSERELLRSAPGSYPKSLK